MTDSMLHITMTRTEAEQVTSRIKLLVESVTVTTEKIITLIEQAESGKAWQALGYQSWTGYVQAEFADSMARLQRAERIPVVQKLSSTGMSTRAIASVVGTSVGTVHSDQHQVFRTEHLAEPTPPKSTTGTDGKSYIRNGRPTARGMQDLANAVPPVQQKPRRRPLPDAYWTAVYDLRKAVERLERLTKDDRFASHAEALFEREGAQLERLAQALHDNVCMPLVRGGGHE